MVRKTSEVGGSSDQHIKDLRASARGALGKGASLRGSAALELMAHGGRVCQRRIAAGKSQKDSVKSALNAALGGVWHEVRANSVFEVGELRVRCAEAVEDIEHIVHHCPAWAAERREVALPASALEAPPC
eukprot:3539353-Amphidinium_carterae.2